VTLFLLLSIIFGLGIGLIYYGIVLKAKPNRFIRVKKRKGEYFFNIIKIFSYLKVVRYFERKLTSTNKLEELLIKGGRPLSLKAKDINLIRIVLPILLGGIFFGLYSAKYLITTVKSITFAYASEGVIINPFHDLVKPIVLLVALVIFGYYAPVLWLQFIAKSREERFMNEHKLFSEILFLSLKANLSVYEALEAAGRVNLFLKPYIDCCLNEWMTDKYKALKNLSKEVGFKSFQETIDLLIQALSTGDEKIPCFIEQNTKLEEELKNIETTTKSKLLPLWGTVQMALPFVLMMIVLFYPLICDMQEMFSRF